jgi:UPF0755 protein
MKRVTLALILLAVILAGLVEWSYAAFTGSGPAAKSGKETVIVIAPGAGVRGAAEVLDKAGVVAWPDVFSLGVRFAGKAGALKAGEYAIPSRASMRDIMNILAAGKSIEHKLTVAEGLTSKMAYDLVAGDLFLAGDAGAVPDEGTLLPETYLFTRGMARGAIVAAMKKAQTALLDTLWRARAPNLPFKTKREALVLASIVEKESAIPAERRHIAAVFVNRLKLGMKLQSDPTIIYGISRGYPLGRGIKASEIAAATPFNTYVIDGLPPTPICNPGRDAIAAVLDPVESRDLYFVADGTGGHVFAATADEQAKNVAKWRKIEKSRKAAP